jgi:hypothetical protein
MKLYSRRIVMKKMISLLAVLALSTAVYAETPKTDEMQTAPVGKSDSSLVVADNSTDATAATSVTEDSSKPAAATTTTTKKAVKHKKKHKKHCCHCADKS